MPREAVALIAARAISVLGDQLARVALTVLVFSRTRSPLLAALAFLATLLPALLGTAWFSGIADRIPRRRVLVAGDVIRAALMATAAIPRLPLVAVLVLVVALTLVDGPWGAARSALLRQVSGDDGGYQRATTIDETCNQSGQIAGYAVGGAACAAFGAHLALGVDALTFVASGTLLSLLLTRRPAAAQEQPAGRFRGWRDAGVGLRAALGPYSRLPLLLAWVGVGVGIAPEAVAVPWSAHFEAGAAGAGLLLAANPVGAVIGLVAIARLPAERAQRMLGPLLVLGLAPMIACGAAPNFAIALALVVAAGVGSSYSALARVRFASTIPDAVRGRAFGIAATGIIVTQGLGLLLAGALAQAFGPGQAIALSGLIGAVGCALVALLAHPPRGRHAVGAIHIPEQATGPRTVVVDAAESVTP